MFNDIFDLADQYTHIIWGDRERSVIVDWDGLKTFNVWQVSDDGTFLNTDVWQSGEVRDVKHASEIAEQRMLSQFAAEDEGVDYDDD